MGLLNKVASQVPLYEYGDAVVKPKKSSKRKIVSPTETSEVDDGKCKEITDDIIVVSEENAMGDGINNPKKEAADPKMCLKRNVKKIMCLKNPKEADPKRCLKRNVKKMMCLKNPKEATDPKMRVKRNVKKMMCLKNPKEGENLNVATQ